MNESRKKKKVTDHKTRIALKSLLFTMFIVGIYLSIATSKSFSLEDCFSFIKNDILRMVILAVLQWIILDVIYGIVFGVWYFFSKKHWKRKNKNRYIEGVWLHIHDKAKVRTGVIDIKQSFSELEVTATNVTPRKKYTEDDARTYWHYLANEFEPNDQREDRLIGCYFACRVGQGNKYGLHLFHNIEGTKYPEKLEGVFGDMIKPGDINHLIKPEELERLKDKTGKIYLYKMPKCIKEYIGYENVDSFDRDKLSNLINHVETQLANDSLSGSQKRQLNKIKATDFYKKLKSVLDKNDCRNRYDNFNKSVKEHLDVQKYKHSFDVYFARILCSTVICDRNLANQELETLNYILGTNWDEQFVNGVFSSFVSPEPDDPDANTFIVNLRLNHNTLWNSLKDLVISTMTCLIHSDGSVAVNEKKCLEEITKLFGA